MSKKQKTTAEETEVFELLRNKLKGLKTEMTIINLALIALGLVMVIIPQQFNDFIGQIIGCALCIWGVLRCITFLRLKSEDAFGSYALVQGAAMLGFGVFFLTQPERFTNLLNSVLVLSVLVAAVMKLQNAINYFKLKIYRWWLHLIAAAVLLVLGIIALIRPDWAGDEASLANMITIIIGCGLILSGIWDLFSVSIMSKRLKMTVKQMEEDGVIPEISTKDKKKDKSKYVRLSEKDVTEKKSKSDVERTEFRDPEVDDIDNPDYGDEFNDTKNNSKK